MAQLMACPVHGRAEICTICRHLREGAGVGYYRVQVPPGSDDHEPGLCEQCAELLWKEKGWTGQLAEFAEWKLFCRNCFEEALRRIDFLARVCSAARRAKGLEPQAVPSIVRRTW